MHAMNHLEKAFRSLRAYALAYPETCEDHPWGEAAIKVRSKAFLFLRHGQGKLSLTLKLAHRHEFALQYPFVAPARYGLGRSGWVTATFSGKNEPPMDVLTAGLKKATAPLPQNGLARKWNCCAKAFRKPLVKPGNHLDALRRGGHLFRQCGEDMESELLAGCCDPMVPDAGLFMLPPDMESVFDACGFFFFMV